MTAIALEVRRRIGAPDRVMLAILAVFVVLALIAPDQAWASVGFTGESLLEIAPFFLLSVAMAAGAKASGADALIGRAFQHRTAAGIALAALIGALSPFCSCGVIPLIAALLAMGVPLPAVMAFWLASPLMDPAMFALTSGTLGLTFAIFKTGAAVGVGLLGGFGTMALMGAGQFREPLRPGIGGGGCGTKRMIEGGPVAWRFWNEASRRETFAQSARSNILFLGKWLTLAFLLESLMLAWVPAEAVATVVGDGWWSVPLAAVVGIPAYLNGYAALPLVGGLMEQGMAPGAAMSFLLAGGVSCIPAAIAVWALARPPVFAAYVGFAFAGSLGAGLLFGLIS